MPYGPATINTGFCGGGCPTAVPLCAAVVDTPDGFVTVNVPAPNAVTTNVPLSGFSVVSPGFWIPLTEIVIPTHKGVPDARVYV